MANKEYWDRIWANHDLMVEEEGSKAGNEYLFSEVLDAVSLSRKTRPFHLEAGCGTGIWNFLLHQEFPDLPTIGIDIADCLMKSGRYVKEKGYSRIYFSKSDIRTLPFTDNAFSLVTCFGVIEHFEDPSCIMKEFLRVLSPGGILFLDTPNHGLWEYWNRWFPIDEYEVYYSPEELAEISEKAGFTVLKKKAVGFSNSVMTPLFQLYEYNPQSVFSRIYHLALAPLKLVLRRFDPWLDSSLGFYSVVVARKEPAEKL